jgi:hypothetical protein
MDQTVASYSSHATNSSLNRPKGISAIIITTKDSYLNEADMNS